MCFVKHTAVAFATAITRRLKQKNNSVFGVALSGCACRIGQELNVHSIALDVDISDVVDRVLDSLDEKEVNDILGIVFYGSRFTGHANEESDFDFFFIMKDGSEFEGGTTAAGGRYGRRDVSGSRLSEKRIPFACESARRLS